MRKSAQKGFATIGRHAWRRRAVACLLAVYSTDHHIPNNRSKAALPSSYEVAAKSVPQNCYRLLALAIACVLLKID